MFRAARSFAHKSPLGLLTYRLPVGGVSRFSAASFHNSPKQNSAVVGAQEVIPKIAEGSNLGKFDGAFLKDFSVGELFSFMVIGMATLNKPLLQLCIKAFPYVPLPIIRALVYKIYCGGESIEEVKQTGARLAERGINNMMISLTIEACDGNDNVDPQFIVEETQRSVEQILIPHTVSMIESSGKDINAIPPGYVALKPTGFVKNAAPVLRNFKNHTAEFDELVEKAAAVCQTIFDANRKMSEQYPERVAPFVVGVIDAEKYELQEGVYELQRRLYQKFNPIGSPVSVVGTLQMYLSGSADLLAAEEKLAQKNNYRLGLKLVRGAYIHSEKQRASIIHKSKDDTDKNYNQGITYCIDSILANSGNESTVGHLVVASHNADSLKLASEKTYRGVLSEGNGNKSNICLGQLLGMADSITYDLIKNDKIDNVIKYVAWGPPLETKDYLLRRLEENGDAVKNDNGLPLVRAATAMMMKKMFA